MTKRTTGLYVTSSVQEEKVRAFMPKPLPPRPGLRLSARVATQIEEAQHNCRLLNLVSQMIPDRDWLLYGFARKEAVLSSQMEGTQATLMDILESEGTESREQSLDVQDVVNYIKALKYCLDELSKPRGLPISVRLLKNAHQFLMHGVRGENKAPGEVRRSQNWIGGTRPGNAKFVPPPPDKVIECLDALEKYIHQNDDLPAVIRAGLVHVQFETIHPFLDGNGRLGRLLITLLLQEWKVLDASLLYLSLYFKRTRQEYYDRLSRVRSDGDWEGWSEYFVIGVSSIALETSEVAQRLFNIIKEQREKILLHKQASVVGLRLLEELPKKPIVTMPAVCNLLSVSKPTAQKAIDLLISLNILSQMGDNERGRKYAFDIYLKELTRDTQFTS